MSKQLIITITWILLFISTINDVLNCLDSRRPSKILNSANTIITLCFSNLHLCKYHKNFVKVNPI